MIVKDLGRFFEKKLRKKTFLQKGFCVVFKIVRSTVVVNRRAFLLLCYAFGVCGLDFDGIMPEFGCRHIPTTSSVT